MCWAKAGPTTELTPSTTTTKTLTTTTPPISTPAPTTTTSRPPTTTTGPGNDGEEGTSWGKIALWVGGGVTFLLLLGIGVALACKYRTELMAMLSHSNDPAGDNSATTQVTSEKV